MFQKYSIEDVIIPIDKFFSKKKESIEKIKILYTHMIRNEFSSQYFCYSDMSSLY